MSAKKRNRIKGSVSILMAVILLPMLAFGGTVTDIARICAARSEAEAALELAINSILAEYDRNLYKYYGLFAVSADEQALTALGEETLHRTCYPEEIFEAADPFSRAALNRLLGRDAEKNVFGNQVKLREVQFSLKPSAASSPANPAVLQKQICEYLKYRGPLQFGEDMLERFGVLSHLDKQTEAVSAKLDYDESAASAEELAQRLLVNLDNFFLQVDTSVYAEDPVQSLRDAVAEVQMLNGFAEQADAYSETAKKLSRALDCDGKDFKDGEGNRGKYENAASLVLQYEADGTSGKVLCAAIMPVFLRYSTLGSAEITENADASFAFVDAVQQAESAFSAYGLACNAVLHFEEKLKDGEKAEIDSSGLDRDAVRKAASTGASRVEYAKDILKTIRDNLSERGKAAEKYASGVSSAYVKAAKDCLVPLNSAEELAKELKETLETLREKKEIWQSTLDALEEGEMKETMQKDFDQSAEMLDAAAVEELAGTVSKTKIFFSDIESAFPGCPVPASREGYLFSREDAAPGSKTAALIQRLDAIGTGDGDASFLDGLKKLVAMFDRTGKSDNCPQLFSSADRGFSFSIINKFIEGAEAGIKDLSIPDFSSEDGAPGDSEVSEAAESGLGGVSSMFSGLGNILSTIGNDLLTVEYLMGNFSCASDDKEKAVSLSGNKLSVSPYFGNEIEYLVYGSDYSALNRAAAYASILTVRFCLNLVYAMTASDLRAESLAAATAVAGWSGFGVPLVQNVILACWALAESIVDMNQLLDGAYVPAYKNAESWSLSLAGLGKCIESGKISADKPAGDEKKGTGLSYRDYLTVFLLIGFPFQREAILGRCAKLIQINMSAMDGGFRLTKCWTAADCTCTALTGTLFAGVIENHGTISGGNESVVELSNIRWEEKGLSVSRIATY